MRLSSLATTWAVFYSLSLFALPQDATIVSGGADLIQTAPGHLQIKTGDKTIIHWKDFSIAKGERLQFLQPSSKSAVLNRVKGEDISSLAGHLQANGQVYLVNPRGVIVGKDAHIQTAGFLVSTLDLTDEAFSLGKECLFQGDSKEAIINYGTIETAEGNITLIARSLSNQGHVSAPHGKVSLLAGQEILLKLEESPLLTIRPHLSEPDGTITHTGHIEALLIDLQAEGRAHTYGINMQGSVLALNTVENGGKIYLKAGSIATSADATLHAPQGSISLEATTGMLYMQGTIQAEQGSVHIKNSAPDALTYHLGTLDVSGERGGQIHIDTPTCINAGSILAHGQTGSGGTIAIHTQGPYVATSQSLLAANSSQSGGQISLHADTTLFSSGTHLSQGEKGGEITLLAPELTLVSANLDASGTSQGGSIFVGGGPHGALQGPYNALKTHIAGNTHLSVSAKEQGAGGTLVVWSDEKTVCYGSIEANAGIRGGDGGWIEVSSKEALHCNASISAQAPQGASGTVLFDPKNIIIDEATGMFPQYAFIDPLASVSPTSPGVLSLSTGNVVISRPLSTIGGQANAGAIYLYDGTTAALISMLTGTQANDLIGSDGVILLTGNGNYVIGSAFWSNGTNANAGAATWGSGLTGVNGAVNPTNSLVGTAVNDSVGVSGTVIPLSTGNYLVANQNWVGVPSSSMQLGAVTFGDGTTGVTGAVSTANSVIGDMNFDRVGVTVFQLSTGNYVINTPSWHNNAGAATWGSGTSGSTNGTVSSANSVIGSTSGDQVAMTVQELIGNGNYILSTSLWSAGAGAVTWVNGSTGLMANNMLGGLVDSTNSLVGKFANDAVSNNPILLLGNGNYVVNSTGANSSDGLTPAVGAVTWGNGGTTGGTGITGTISTTNSLFGSHASDGVGLGGIVELANHNYVVISPNWNGHIGAVTWGDGLTGVTGIVSAGNSLVGSAANDQVGSRGVAALDNGNYVVFSPSWSSSQGAVTWGNGLTGTITGLVSASNSLVGNSGSSDQIGSGGISLLPTNGNYVVRSPLYGSGIGATTWGNGGSGVAGTVSPLTNSIVGSTAGDNIGNQVAVLTNGNYVLISPTWSNNMGAVTWAPGTMSITGTVSSSNSLVGTTTSDSVGSNGITQLTHGNYVIGSSSWSNAGQVGAGAATWANGTVSITGQVSPSNSIVGSMAGDIVGNTIATLTNGNFVLLSPNWTNGIGAATWGDGTHGTAGIVSSANSLVGTAPGDNVGNAIVELGNQNYVIVSPLWNGAAGAVTWASGTSAVSGVVGPTNSIVGTSPNDGIGNSVHLVGNTSSNFVIVSPTWKNLSPATNNAGAVTWGSGLGGTVGTVSAANSLVGIINGTRVGFNGITVLSNGNYVVTSTLWKSALAAQLGAVTWASGESGIVGTISSLNSLVGGTAGDEVGSNGVLELGTTGNFTVSTNAWHNPNGSLANAGAVTWGDGTHGVPVGTVSEQNSIVGIVAGSGLQPVIPDLTSDIFIVLFAAGTANSGQVVAGYVYPNQINFGSALSSVLPPPPSPPPPDMVIAPSFLTQLLNVGTAVTLQANNDITINSSNAINSTGTGALTLMAGRSVLVNGNLITAGGPIAITANTPASQGVVDAYRDPGTAVIDIASGVTLSPGTGNLTLLLSDGAGNTNHASGDLTIGDNATLQCTGAGQLSLTALTNNISLGNTSLVQTATGSLQLSAGQDILATGPSTIQTLGNDLTINTPVNATGAGALTLAAGRSVSIEQSITTAGGAVSITANTSLNVNANINTGAGNLTLLLSNATLPSGNLTIGAGNTLQCSGAGLLTVTAQEKTISLGTNSTLQAQDGTLQLSAGLDITAAGLVTLKTLGTGELILICDALFPTPPQFGNGFVDLPQAQLTTGGGKLLIYTAQRALNTVPASINNVPYVPGPEFVNTTTEKWGVYYPNSSGIPFTIFYKESESPPPPPPPPPGPPGPPPSPTPPSPQVVAASTRASYAAIIATAEPFQFWMNPWYSDPLFGTNIYPPYLTPTVVRRVLPSLSGQRMQARLAKEKSMKGKKV